MSPVMGESGREAIRVSRPPDKSICLEKRLLTADGVGIGLAVFGGLGEPRAGVM